MMRLVFLIKFTIVSFIVAPCVTFAGIDAGKHAQKEARFQEAKDEYRISAELGNAESQYLLAQMHIDRKFGLTDSAQAYAWMSLAALANYPKAAKAAKAMFADMSGTEKAQAQVALTAALEKYGKTALQKRIYPALTPASGKPGVVNASIASKSKRKIGRLPIKARRAKSDKVAFCIPPAYKYSIYSSRCDYSNEDNSLGISSTVIVYNLDEQGRVEDPEVLFSYPYGYNHYAMLYLLYAEHKPARDENGRGVRQEGLTYVSHSTNSYYERIGPLKGVDSLSRLDREALQALKAEQNNSLEVKYRYASALRTLDNAYSLKDITPFTEVLREAALAGHARAQLDYAEYQIFQNNQINEGMPYLLMAASGGMADAQYRLGDLLMSPVFPSIKTDREKAAFWLERAAEKSHVAATEKLAQLLLSEPASDNTDKAIALLKRVVTSENHSVSTAQSLVDAYMKAGKRKEAEHWLNKAIRLAKQSGYPREELESLKYSLGS